MTMLTIIASLQDEIRLIKSEMEIDKAIHVRPFSIFSGKYKSKKITLVRTGMGKEQTETALNYYIKNFKSELIMNIGYSGGLDPHLHAGDISISKSVIDELSQRKIDVDENLISRAKSSAESGGLRFHIGKTVTVEKPIHGPHEKAFAGTKFEAIACDMESATIAKYASNAKIPFFVVRAVIDPMDVELPEIPESAIIEGSVKLGRFIKHLKSSPKDILKIPKLSFLANQARISITNFVKEWIRNEENL